MQLLASSLKVNMEVRFGVIIIYVCFFYNDGVEGMVCAFHAVDFMEYRRIAVYRLEMVVVFLGDLISRSTPTRNDYQIEKTIRCEE